jgi:hypothetical protein
MKKADRIRLLSRRDFGRCCAGTMAAALAGGPTAPGARPEAGAGEFPPGRCVDMHTHLGQVGNTTAELTAAGLLKWMDANDVAQAVVLPLVSPEAAS